MECGPGVDSDVLADIEREMSGLPAQDRGEGPAASPRSTRSTESVSSESAPTVEGPMEDVIGTSSGQAEPDARKTKKSKKSSLKWGFNKCHRSREEKGEGKDSSAAANPEGGIGKEETSVPKSALRSMFQKVAQKPSMSRLLHAFGNSSRTSVQNKGGDGGERSKAGSSKTLGRLMHCMGPKASGSKKLSLSKESSSGGDQQEQKTMTLGRRIVENLGSTVRGLRSYGGGGADSPQPARPHSGDLLEPASSSKLR